MSARYEYKVIQVREGLIGDKIDSGKLEDRLNEHAREGWQVRTVTPADVKGRMGPGSSDGLIIVLERPVG